MAVANNCVFFISRRAIQLLALLLLSLPAQIRGQNVMATRVMLDPETFPEPNRRGLQEVADRVALQVDALIPGRVGGIGDQAIICFEAPQEWSRDPAHR